MMARVPQRGIDGPVGNICLVETSTNLVDWEATGVAADQGEGLSACEHTNAAPLPNRFQRVVLL